MRLLRNTVVLALALAFVASSLAVCTASSSEANAQDVTKIVLQVDPKPDDSWPKTAQGRKAVLSRVKAVLQKRAALLDTTSAPEVTVSGDGSIIVELLGLASPTTAAAKLAQTGRLGFYYLKDVRSPKHPSGRWMMEPGTGLHNAYIFKDGKGNSLNSRSSSDAQKIMTRIVGVPSNKPLLTGADLLPNAKAYLQGKDPAVDVEFSVRASKTFGDFSAKHIGDVLAIVYSDRLLTAPRIMERITEGTIMISGFGSLKDAAEVANSVNMGALPVHLKVVRVTN